MCDLSSEHPFLTGAQERSSGSLRSGPFLLHQNHLWLILTDMVRGPEFALDVAAEGSPSRNTRRVKPSQGRAEGRTTRLRADQSSHMNEVGLPVVRIQIDRLKLRRVHRLGLFPQSWRA